MKKDIILGAHVPLSAPDYLLNSLRLSISYGAKAMMFYTGAPQNTKRAPLEKFKIDDFKRACQEEGINLTNVVVHAPYIVNLASANPDSRKFSQDFILQELVRTAAIGGKYLVLHPGAHVGQGIQKGLDLICEGLNNIFEKAPKGVEICLETMAGKGTEIGSRLEEIALIIKNVRGPVHLCADTCHMHDSGYDISTAKKFYDLIQEKVGFDHLKVIHINDSKGEINCHSDRHENIGYGKIGFTALKEIVNAEIGKEIVKILETPWIDDFCPYKAEIEILSKQNWVDFKNKIHEQE